MVLSKRTTTRPSAQLSAQEAYNIWDLLASKYLEIERLTMWETFAHDTDLKLHIDRVRAAVLRDAGSWERIATRTAVKGPDAPRRGIHTSINSEIFHDEHIAMWLLQMLQQDLEQLFRVVRTCMRNDAIRRKAMAEIKRVVTYLDDYVQYVKLKGWIGQPPLYPNVPKDSPEQLSCGEAGHLWDHLTFRYDNIDQNRAIRDAVHDGDFKIVLDAGIRILSRQIRRLEKELLAFGIPLPKAPPVVHAVIEDTEYAEDDQIFRLLLTGLQGAVLLHVKAFIHSTTNDRLRAYFKKLLISEMGLTEKLVLYGKVKGWLNPPPTYAQ